MAKYLLCGGNDRAVSGFANSILGEIYTVFPRPKVLSCFFSIGDEEVDEKFLSWRQWWRQNNASFASYNCAEKRNFEEQVKESDVIFFHGGDNLLLLSQMDQYSGVEELFSDKLIIGSSAGANWLSRRFYSRSLGGWQEGSGIVPWTVMVHYGISEQDNPIDWLNAESLVADAPIKKIREGEFLVYENN